MIEKEELSSVIPHRGRMLLLSRIVGYNLQERSIEAEYHVTEDCIFYDSAMAGVPAWVGFEFIAQTISAFSGIRNREKSEPPRIGFVLAVSQMKIGVSCFKAGSILTIKTRETEDMHPVYAFDGEIFLDGQKLIEGKLMVMEVDK